MQRKETYKTKQKDIILDTIKKQEHDFTIKDIYEKLNHEVGLTTIYRLVDKLVDNGALRKNIDKDNITYYEYLEECSCDNHFYLKCDKCGAIEHVDCDCINELSMHILKEHDFKLNKQHIFINGLCHKCI